MAMQVQVLLWAYYKSINFHSEKNYNKIHNYQSELWVMEKEWYSRAFHIWYNAYKYVTLSLFLLNGG